MRQRRWRHGVTLAELLIALTVTGILLSVIFALIWQTDRLYINTTRYIGPNAAMVLAHKHLQRDLREAMAIVSSSNGTRLEVQMPLKDQAHLNIVQPGTDELLVLQPGQTIIYFLGRRSYPTQDHHHWQAVPDATGDTLFRVPGTAIPVNGGYNDAPVLITGILPVAKPPDPQHPGQYLETTIFRYGPDDTNVPVSPDTRLVKISLTQPVTRIALTGKVTVYHTSQTQLCLRNLATSGQ